MQDWSDSLYPRDHREIVVLCTSCLGIAEQLCPTYAPLELITPAMYSTTYKYARNLVGRLRETTSIYFFKNQILSLTQNVHVNN